MLKHLNNPLFNYLYGLFPYPEYAAGPESEFQRISMTYAAFGIVRSFNGMETILPRDIETSVPAPLRRRAFDALVNAGYLKEIDTNGKVSYRILKRTELSHMPVKVEA